MVSVGQIIVLEDDKEDQEILEEALKEIAVISKLVFFENALDAIAYLSMDNGQPFLILVDMNLPIMNGLEFQEKIDENEYLRKKSIPLVFLTTTDNRTTIEKAYERPVQGFFTKPSSFSELKESLTAIINYWRICKHPIYQGF
jgi:CheY-like chemotaxis protein